MDVVPDTDLFDFVDSLGGEKEEEVDRLHVSTGSNPGQEEEEVETDIWSDIATASNNWSQRVLDAGSKYNRSGNLPQTIEDSIYRQQLDGFLTTRDIAELRFITDVLNAVSCCGVGFEFVNIITMLLELYSLRQIISTLFIETCLKLL